MICYHIIIYIKLTKMKNLKALTIGGATLDTIIEYEEMFTMSMQKKDTIQSFMLLEEGAKIEVTDQKSFLVVGLLMLLFHSKNKA